MKETVDKLERVRKATGIDLTYAIVSVGADTGSAGRSARKDATRPDERRPKTGAGTGYGCRAEFGSIQGVSEYYSGYSPGMPVPTKPVVTFSVNVRFSVQ